MNTANKLTLLRVIMIPVFMVALYWSFPFHKFVALILFILASVTDFIDGYVARNFDQTTDFGKFMDPLADKLLVTAAMLWFVEVGQMSAWYVLTALGIHMVAPSSNIFYVNTPLFTRTEIRLDHTYHRRRIADTLTIVCDRDPDAFPYIRGIEVNGTPIHRAWLTWEEISDGGEIRFLLSDTPDSAFAKVLP